MISLDSSQKSSIETSIPPWLPRTRLILSALYHRSPIRELQRLAKIYWVSGDAQMRKPASPSHIHFEFWPISIKNLVWSHGAQFATVVVVHFSVYEHIATWMLGFGVACFGVTCTAHYISLSVKPSFPWILDFTDSRFTIASILLPLAFLFVGDFVLKLMEKIADYRLIGRNQTFLCSILMLSKFIIF